MKYEIYTDGACSGNPGPGGWGVLLRYQGHEKCLKGGCEQTTNNQMELTAALEGLKALTKKSNVIITTDSTYLKNGVTVWSKKWQQNHWQTASKKPVKNKTIWQALLKEVALHQVQWRWVKAHNGHVDNEWADQLANEGLEEHLKRGVE